MSNETLINAARQLIKTSDDPIEIAHMVEKLCRAIEGSKLKEACEDYMEYLADEDSNSDSDEDYENDIFEKAMKYCLGEDVFDEVNRLIEERDERE